MSDKSDQRKTKGGVAPEKMMFGPQIFVGTVLHKDDVVPLEFEISADEKGFLSIKTLPLDNQYLMKLNAAMGKPGSYVEPLALKGTAKDGSTFLSETIELQGINCGAANGTASLKAREATLTINMDEPAKEPFMRLWFRGFKSHRNPVVTMSLGKVEVGGSNKKTSKDEMSGSVSVHASEAEFSDIDSWVKQTDEFLTFMHRGLGFAHGGRLQTPRLDVVVGTRWQTTFYDGHGFLKNLSPIHYMYQGPFIEALTKRFDDPKPFPDMLWTAIGWLYDDISIAEGRFLMAMTALETVVEHVLPKASATVIPKPEFVPIRKSLVEILKSYELDEAAAKIFEGKLKGLNARTLSEKIQALRDHYCLSDAIFPDSVIVDIIKIRNDIIHTGKNKKQQDLLSKEIFVREFISQIVFSELNYVGPYQSYINGYQFIHPQSNL
ncbi:hypothetical protein [Pectobacterium carotovorum]|uniref:hypothetical protein n=1 Tax=Pectobacterium carotovorum TaxID=554 RepID=UPI001E44A25F|nr:hypothetical protein [Pectobacterium carotovorum]UFT95003.1 hypothetical protein LQF52_02925 [Pectobacterium carotovorum]